MFVCVHSIKEYNDLVWHGGFKYIISVKKKRILRKAPVRFPEKTSLQLKLIAILVLLFPLFECGG